MSNEKNSLNRVDDCDAYCAAAAYAFAIWPGSQLSTPTLSANASMPFEAACAMSACGV